MRRKKKTFFRQLVASFLIVFVGVLLFLGRSLINNARLFVRETLGFTSSACVIKGNKRIESDLIYKTIGFSDQKALCDYNLNDVLEKLLSLKHIEYACVRKDYPSTMRIFIKEREPVAQLFSKGVYYLVDDKGTVFSSIVEPALLPIITGTGAAKAAGPFLKRLPSFQKHVCFMRRIDERRWNLILKNGYTVELPEDKDVKQDFDLENLPFDPEYNVVDTRFYFVEAPRKRKLIYKKKVVSRRL